MMRALQLHLPTRTRIRSIHYTGHNEYLWFLHSVVRIVLPFLTLCLSMRMCFKWGSYRSCFGSTFTGDWRLPLLHRLHSGLTRPQNSGPESKCYNKNDHYLQHNSITCMCSNKSTPVSMPKRNHLFKKVTTHIETICSLIASPTFDSRISFRVERDM